MRIVAADQIPIAGPTPVDNLMDLYKVCQKMETICDLHNGIGLSAVQVGLPWKFFIYKKPDGKYAYMVDCEYEPVGEEKAASMEGCLSLPDSSGNHRMFMLQRFRTVRVFGQQLLSEDQLKLVPVDTTETNNIYSVVFQHEIDHHRNILISDIGKEIQIELL